MEQKTEASQAVDEPMRAAFWRFIATLPTPVQDNISTSAARGESITAKAFESGYRAALKAQPAPTEAPTYTCTLDGDPCGMGGYCKDCHAPTEAAQGALSANPNLTTSGVTCQPVAAQGNTSNNSSSSQLSGNSGELAQGEDSVRLDAALLKARKWIVKNRPALTLSRAKTIDEYMGLLDIIDRARASAETGGVKP